MFLYDLLKRKQPLRGSGNKEIKSNHLIKANDTVTWYVDSEALNTYGKSSSGDKVD